MGYKTYLLRYVKTSEAFSELLLSIPGREVVNRAREEDGLDHSENRSYGEQLTIGLDRSCGSRDGSPYGDCSTDI